MASAVSASASIQLFPTSSTMRALTIFALADRGGGANQQIRTLLDARS